MTHGSEPSTTVDEPTGYDLMLSPGWVRVPLHRPGARRLVRRMVQERAGDQPQDTVTAARVLLEREMLSMVDRAADAGAVDLFMLAQQRHGAAVAASLTVTYVPLPGAAAGGALDLGDIAQRLRAPDGEAGVTDLPSGPAVRTVRRRFGPGMLGSLPDDGAAPDGAAPEIEVVVVEYVVPVPHAAGTQLLMTFSSPNVTMQEAMVTLFDAIASTLHWKWPR